MSALSWESVTVRYGAREALSLGPLAFEPGQFVALLGPNGSGKSSLLKALAGAVPADVAGMSVAGVDRPDRRQRARTLAYLSQDRVGPGLARVREVVALGRHAHGGRDPDGRVAQCMARLDLDGLADRRFGELSGGERARVLLARALAVGAPVLLADEPTASLDPHYALSMMAALRTEAKRGALVIVSLHDLDLAARYADAALILQSGRLRVNGPVTDVLDPATLADVFRLRRGSQGWEPA